MDLGRHGGGVFGEHGRCGWGFCWWDGTDDLTWRDRRGDKMGDRQGRQGQTGQGQGQTWWSGNNERGWLSTAPWWFSNH